MTRLPAQWYYEQRSMTGKWSPVLTSQKPDYQVKNGEARERRLSGPGARIRAIQRVPDHMVGLTLNELRDALTTEKVEVTEGGAV